MCAQGTASAFLPKTHRPKLPSSEDQRREGAGSICCPPRQDDAPHLILQVAGAAPRAAGLGSSGSLWFLGIWITYSWLLQPYAEQHCWKIYTWATCKVQQLKSPGLATPAQGTQAWLSCSTLLKAATLSTHRQLQTLSGFSSSKSQPCLFLVLLQWKTSYALRETQIRANFWLPAKPLIYFKELKMTESYLHEYKQKWGKGGERKQ